MQRELSMSTKGIRFLDTFCIHFHLYTLSNFVAHLTKMSIADLIVVPSSVAQCWFIAADDRTPKHIHTNRQTAIPLYPGLLHFMTVANDNKDNSCVTILIGTFFTPQRGVKYLGYLVVILTKLKAFASQVASLCSRDGSRMMIN